MKKIEDKILYLEGISLEYFGSSNVQPDSSGIQQHPHVSKHGSSCLVW